MPKQLKQAVFIGFPNPEGYGEMFMEQLGQAGFGLFATNFDVSDDYRTRADELGVKLMTPAVNFNAAAPQETRDNLKAVTEALISQGVTHVDALITTPAGGLRRDRRFSTAYGKGLERGQVRMNDLPNDVIRNMAFVNSEGHELAIRAFHTAGLLSPESVVLSTTYCNHIDGAPGYFLAPTKRDLEQRIARLATELNLRTCAISLPKAVTSSSKIFGALFPLSIFDYLEQIQGQTPQDPVVRSHFEELERSLATIADGDERIRTVTDIIFHFFRVVPPADLVSDSPLTNHSSTVFDLANYVVEQINELEAMGTIRDQAIAISRFNRAATARIIARDLIEAGHFEPGETRIVFPRHLLRRIGPGNEPVTEVVPAETKAPGISTDYQTPNKVERAEITALLGHLYGEQLLFLDEAEISDDGKFARGWFQVPEQRDYLGGKVFPNAGLQEAANQLAILLFAYRERDLPAEKRAWPIMNQVDVNYAASAKPGDRVYLEVESLRSEDRLYEVLRTKVENEGLTNWGDIHVFLAKDFVFRRRHGIKK